MPRYRVRGLRTIGALWVIGCLFFVAKPPTILSGGNSGKVETVVRAWPLQNIAEMEWRGAGGLRVYSARVDAVRLACQVGLVSLLACGALILALEDSEDSQT